MDYKRIYKIAAKIILSKTMTENEWKKYHEEHPHAKRENHIIIPSSTSILQENKNKRHKRKDNARNREVRRLLKTLRLHIEKKYNKLQERIHSGHEFIVPNNIRSADNGIEDAKKHIKEISDRDITNKNNGTSVHITSNDEDKLIYSCYEEGKYNLYQIAALITSNIDVIFENSVFISENKSKPVKEDRNKKQDRSVFLYTEIYNGACKVNGKIFSVVFTVGFSRFHNAKTKKEEIKGRLYHFRLINIKKLLPPMGKLIPGKHFGSRINEKSIKNWEKAKTHIIDLGEVDITPPPKRSYTISQYLEKSN